MNSAKKYEEGDALSYSIILIRNEYGLYSEIFVKAECRLQL